MAYLIGIDEAGYGPNLGPLTIGATVWQTTDVQWSDLFEPVAPAIARHGEQTAATWMTVGDSKQLYSPQRGLGALELAVQTALRCAGAAAADDLELLQNLSPDTWSDHSELPWYQATARVLPTEIDRDKVDSHSDLLDELLGVTEIRLVRMASRIIEPPQFNHLCERLGNKATVLSQQSLELLAQMLEGLDEGPVFCHCDRHGGRTQYRHLLQTQFQEQLIEVYGEAAHQSVYRWGAEPNRIEVRFSTGGERHWEVAWASMLAKYLRELAMARFNRFWLAHDPALKPTKGYPVDAKRFRADIAPVQASLDITEGLYWRSR